MSPEEQKILETNGAANRPSVLVADDDPAIRLVLRHRLESAGYRVAEAADSQGALEGLLSNRHDVALIDIMMPGAGGLEVLTEARTQGVRTLIVIITAASTMDNAVEAMKREAHDYLTKPFENLDLVVAAVANAVEIAAQAADLTRLKDEVNRQLVGGEIIGASAAMQEVYKLIGRVVNNDATVLLRGESGTGKELVARAIHFKSPRWRGPFVAVNCSAIPHGLLESELFGHERGAFTGATERRAGKFEQAVGGTVFLDEIGDLPIELQPKLLRVLQEREFSRVGGFETLRMQARIIAATNQDLETAVAAKKFREDLYFRLRVIPIDLPPLRERREDITNLTDYFVGKAVREMGAKSRYISPEARTKLGSYEWPGNVRELENTVLRAALLAPATTIRADDIELGRGGSRAATPLPGAGATLAELITQRIADLIEADGGEPHDLYQKLVAELEKPLIELALERAAGNQVHAARILGLNRNTLRKKLTEHRIVPHRAPPT
ncbi:MAG: sigma-54-dependent Fis family transcriptional regulator [Candidatus Binataceae bacterium]|nr:sigma-54-dependent Fis family transcriptional regulator [Candidatus Binataceae bacterium]